MRPVCVIGLGLIGGSVLRAAARAGRPVFGADPALTENPEFRFESTVESALTAAAEANALVVLAVPLTSVDDVLRLVATHAPSCLLTDVVSVKAPVAASVARRAPAARYAGGHPMSGSTSSGWAAATETMFDGASWVITTDDDTDAVAWREAAALAFDSGARVVPASAIDHDEAVARISHLPHVLAAVLASTGASGGTLALSLAAGSFTDGTRVAGTRAELVLAMCEGNRGPLLAAVDEALGRLGAARGALASTGALAATVRAGNEGRAALEALRASEFAEVRVELGAAGAFAELRALGMAGGRVLRLEGDTAVGERPA